MANIIKKVTAGQKFTPSAHEWNAIADVVNAHDSNRLAEHKAIKSFVVNVANSTLQTIKAYELCYINGYAQRAISHFDASDIMSNVYYISPYNDNSTSNPDISTDERIPVIPQEDILPYATQGGGYYHDLPTGRAVLMGESLVRLSKTLNLNISISPAVSWVGWDGRISTRQLLDFPAVMLTSIKLAEDDDFYYARAMLGGGHSGSHERGQFDVFIKDSSVQIFNSTSTVVYSSATSAGTVQFGVKSSTVPKAEISNPTNGTYVFIRTFPVSNNSISSEIVTGWHASDNSNHYTYLGRIIMSGGRMTFERNVPLGPIYIHGRWSL